ncbi:Carbonic anhydrase 2 [Corynebacterium deserti GIMN1.010]|uniref:Carbonic anhydrase n=1 Tax=Corynebacterium deserti GIMN1.010 TaxID=931089 RepID=A0A0M4CJZ5_9CORY|nr:carbonic anhydrase [Corynebacterium deserti]ALC06771.1 Carbonic anhydrase 2 [Corynebacterium deserti GIMN1.010]
MPLRNVERTPAAVWNALSVGNERFMNFNEDRPNQDAPRRRELRAGQRPAAVVISCSDSRVPVELIFDVGLGDLFVVRTAGEILDQAVFASIEYAIESIGVPLVIVMGHESCGAVAATANALEGGEIPGGYQRVLIEKVAPSILEAKAEGLDTIKDFEEHHVVATVNQILSRSPEIKREVDAGTVGIIGLRYRLSDGRTEPVISKNVGI